MGGKTGYFFGLFEVGADGVGETFEGGAGKLAPGWAAERHWDGEGEAACYHSERGYVHGPGAEVGGYAFGPQWRGSGGFVEGAVGVCGFAEQQVSQPF